MTNRTVRKKRIRSKIDGGKNKPRVCIYKSSKNIYLQAIDDSTGKTLASSSTLKDKDLAKELASQLKILKIKQVVFDRGGYQYHGQVKKIAEDLRNMGLEF